MIVNTWGAMSCFSRTLSRSRSIAALLVAATLLGSCKNLFQDFTDKTNAEYIKEQTKIKIDAGLWDEAIVTVAPLLADQPQDPEVAYLASSAYAGRAGLRILDAIVAIGSDAGSKGMFEIFAELLVNADLDDQADLETAMTIVENYGAAASDRNADVNFYALFLYYARIGARLAPVAYTDGTKRTDFTACCKDTGCPTSVGISDDDVDVVLSTIPRILDTMNGIAVSGSGIDTLAGLTLPPSFTNDPLPCSAASTGGGSPGSDYVVPCTLARSMINQGATLGGLGLGLDTGAGLENEAASGACNPLTVYP